jgi:hypothetical protein
MNLGRGLEVVGGRLQDRSRSKELKAVNNLRKLSAAAATTEAPPLP